MQSEHSQKQSIEKIYQQAVELHTDGKIEDAITLYRQVVEAVPQADMVLYNLGLALFVAEDFLAAKESFERALEVNDHDPDYWFNLALSCKQLGSLKETLAAYRNALQRKSDDIEILYSFGCYCKDCGAIEEAVTLYTHILELDPTYVPAINNLAYLHHVLENHEQAKRLYQLVLDLIPDHAGARHMLAALHGETAEAPSEEYVKNLFDHYSEDFDSSLIDGLDYRVPELLWNLVSKEQLKKQYQHALDLGCGTGLCGKLFRSVAKRLDGIDLSPGMIEKAREKQIYDDLQEAELLQFLTASATQYDLFLAADVFNYFGNLEQVFAALQKSGTVDAHLVFSVEKAGDISSKDGWQLGQNGRYCHSHEYIVHTATSYGFNLQRCTSAELRKERGLGVEGMLYFFVQGA